MVDVANLFQTLAEDAKRCHHRRLLVISGPQSWCEQQASQLAKQPDCLLLGRPLPGFEHVIPTEQSQQLLGRSLGHVIFNAWDGLNPNTLGLVSGTLTGGHVMVLLCPDLDHWAEYNDPEHQQVVAYPYSSEQAGRRFISRLACLLEDDAFSFILRPETTLMEIPQELPSVDIAILDHTEPQPVAPHLSHDQQQAVELILSQFRRGRRPVVLTADRGRGKTAALGIAAAQLSGLEFNDVLLSAPEVTAVKAAFDIAEQLLPEYSRHKNTLSHKAQSIRFVTPEQALAEPGEGQVLLVDEAAAIPVPMLERLLQRFPRIAFASTLHGYEGTGQGFAVRFMSTLQAQAANTRSIHLHTPIRWHADDPLERLIFNGLLLNAGAAEFTANEAEQVLSGGKVIRLDRDELCENYELLTQLFGLLVLAHYRTTPGDLRVLLDSPNLHIWVAIYAGKVAGAVLVAEEGPLPEDLVEEIWSGARRPRGHLLPQTLVNQEGYRQAANLSCGRIMRIAVHPALRRSGLATRLLHAVTIGAEALGWDYLGASFAADTALLNFWQQTGFQVVRMGQSKDQVSGCHAALVARPLSVAGDELMAHIAQRFLAQVSYRLGDDLCQLEPELVCALLLQMQSPLIVNKGANEAIHEAMSEADRSDLIAFAQHHRSYESCAFAIHKALLSFFRTVEVSRLQRLLPNPAFRLLLQRNLQQQSWQQLERDGQGRKQMIRQLREVVALIFFTV